MERFIMWTSLVGMLLVALSQLLQILDGGGYVTGLLGSAILLFLAGGGVGVMATRLWTRRAQAARSRRTSSR